MFSQFLRLLKTSSYMKAAQTAPVMGPNQKSQWSVQMPATAEAPKERAVGMRVVGDSVVLV